MTNGEILIPVIRRKPYDRVWVIFIVPEEVGHENNGKTLPLKRLHTKIGEMVLILCNQCDKGLEMALSLQTPEEYMILR